MSYIIELTSAATIDIEKLKKAGAIKVLQKIDQLLNELREHPFSGTGKPEPLKYYQVPTWSRKINNKHRLIYRVDDDRVVVLVLSFLGHYGDK